LLERDDSWVDDVKDGEQYENDDEFYDEHDDEVAYPSDDVDCEEAFDHADVVSGAERVAPEVHAVDSWDGEEEEAGNGDCPEECSSFYEGEWCDEKEDDEEWHGYPSWGGAVSECFVGFFESCCWLP